MITWVFILFSFLLPWESPWRNEPLPDTVMVCVIDNEDVAVGVWTEGPRPDHYIDEVWASFRIGKVTYSLLVHETEPVCQRARDMVLDLERECLLGEK